MRFANEEERQEALRQAKRKLMRDLDAFLPQVNTGEDHTSLTTRAIAGALAAIAVGFILYKGYPLLLIAYYLLFVA